jgi:hypothetical protein
MKNIPMKITLRKANSIRNTIEDEIKSLKFNYKITIDRYEDNEEAIEKATVDYANTSAKRDSLLEALYEIRGLVGDANVSSGINAMLITLAHLDKDIVFIDKMACAGPRLSEKSIAGKVNELLNNEKSLHHHYGDSHGAQTSIFSEENIEKQKKTLSKMKKIKRESQDKLMELNIQTKISLSQNVVKTLSELDII